MKIRKANLNDFDIIWKILSKTPELHSDPDLKTYDKDWLKSVITKKENLVLIAEDQKLLGFLIAHFLDSVRQTILNDLFVVPEVRKTGIAKMLFKECEKISRKKRYKYLTALVLTNNLKMKNFMEKNGFKRENKFYFYEKRLK